MTIIDPRNPPPDPFQHDGPQTSWERPMPETPTCNSCKWWDRAEPYELVVNQQRHWVNPGLCCIRAPHHDRLPTTHSHNWCGEHTPKETANA